MWTAMARATVLLADDHPGNKRLLRQLLEGTFDVVADVGDGDELVREAERLSPDVIVTDIAMPAVNGIEAARRILACNPDARIVFVTGHSDAALVDLGLAAGALGYVSKLVAGEWLVTAVLAALRGERAVFSIGAR
jgi:DNA-binding NarL/FixJ family response regulator